MAQLSVARVAFLLLLLDLATGTGTGSDAGHEQCGSEVCSDEDQSLAQLRSLKRVQPRAAARGDVYCNPDPQLNQRCPGGHRCPQCGGSSCLCTQAGSRPARPTPNAVYCNPHLGQRCPGGHACPQCGQSSCLCGAGPTPASTHGGSPASHGGPYQEGGSPALKWQSPSSPASKVQSGFQAVQRIKAEGVIDRFMESYPEIKKVLWDGPFNTPDAVRKMQSYAEKLTINVDLKTYMKERGFVFKKKTRKRTHWVNPQTGEKRSAKPTRDWAEKNGPNNGFMRVFFHDVFTKLHLFDPNYGFDESLVDALFDGHSLTLINKKYSKKWGEANTPRKWVLPQMHYLGVFANDIASGADQNFALTIGEPPVATPVDLDATWRGPLSSFLKVLSPSQASMAMQNNYLQIH